MFRPALKCEGRAERPVGQLSKLGVTNKSDGEWRALSFVRDAIAAATANGRRKRPNAVQDFTVYYSPENYFIVPTEICTPAPLETTDLEEFDAVCAHALGQIQSGTVNDRRALELRILQVRDGGPTVENRARGEAPQVASEPFWSAMLGLLANGIVPLNQRGVIHHDIKFNNVVYNDSEPFVRLIDWDHAIRLDAEHYMKSVREGYNDFRTAMQQPIAYAFLCKKAHDVLSRRLSKDGARCQLYRVVSRLHKDYETRGERYAGVSESTDNVGGGVWEQLGTILDKFYNELTGDFNWRAYSSLLVANYDVYGWLALVNYCAQHYMRMFSDHASTAFYTRPELKLFLLKYMYSPDTLAEPYNLHDLSREFSTIVTVPPEPDLKRFRRVFPGPGV